MNWHLDEDGFIRSQFGTKIARFEAGTLMLYERKLGINLPFTIEDYRLLATNARSRSTPEAATKADEVDQQR